MLSVGVSAGVFLRFKLLPLFADQFWIIALSAARPATSNLLAWCGQGAALLGLVGRADGPARARRRAFASDRRRLPPLVARPLP
jgi:hypothetical protein